MLHSATKHCAPRLPMLLVLYGKALLERLSQMWVVMQPLKYALPASLAKDQCVLNSSAGGHFPIFTAHTAKIRSRV